MLYRLEVEENKPKTTDVNTTKWMKIITELHEII